MSLTILSTSIFTLVILTLGYMSFGFLTTLIFMSGFLSGLILWLVIPTSTSWNIIKVPYLITFSLFILHRVEEKVMNFFPALANITGVETPEILSLEVILLVFSSVGAWLLIPHLIKRNYSFGYFLAWTFFAAMGVTELAHFIFPLFTGERYGYFPGMASVILLAPAAWWGIYRLTRKNTAV